MSDDDTRPREPPFPDSLCPKCVACGTVSTKSSTFLMCTALPTKYPRQPVKTCAAFFAKPLPVVPP